MRPCVRRSFVLLAVMAIVGSSLLIVTGLSFHAQADRIASTVSAEKTQSASLLWSGVQIVMGQLHALRDVILDGEFPLLDPQYSVFEQGASLGVIRLQSIGGPGELVVPEAGRLDLNSIDAEMLHATGLVDSALAESIITYQEQTLGRPFQSVAELLHVEGMTPEIFYGDLAETATDSELPRQDAAPALADIVTAFSVEPMLRRDGSRRIPLDTPWSDDLAREIDRRFDRDLAAVISALMQGSNRPKSTAELIRALRRASVPLDRWPEITDAFAPRADEFAFGRLDLNSAPYEALLALPGMTAEQAGQLQQVRDGLTSEQRATPLWPVLTEILNVDGFAAMADYVTNRCWTYRVRIEAGLVDAENPDGPLEHSSIAEIVIDLAGSQPRIAYWRDVTMLDTVILLAAAEIPRGAGHLSDEHQRRQSPVGEVGAYSDDSAAPAVDEEFIERDERPAAAADGFRKSEETPDFDGPESEPVSEEVDPALQKPDAANGKRIGRWIAGS